MACFFYTSGYWVPVSTDISKNASELSDQSNGLTSLQEEQAPTSAVVVPQVVVSALNELFENGP